MNSLNLQYNPRIDQLRWLAATIVFLFHFQLEYRGLGGPALATPWAGLITEGHTGVGLFFTLFLLFVRFLPAIAAAEVKSIMPQPGAGKSAH